MQRLFAYFFQIFKVLYDKIVIMMNENVYFPMYLPQNCPVAQKMLITRFVQNNPVAVMFSEENSFEETSLSGSLVNRVIAYRFYP